MSRRADERAQLCAALGPGLPGRVSAYPPTKATEFVAPYIWIEQPAVARTPIGNRSVGTVAAFPVVVNYDGAVRAQVAGLDDIVSAAWDAVTQVGDPREARPTELDVGGTRLRATVITVEITITAKTLCPPAVVAAPIPPVPLQEAHRG